jgi:hypothetical protein
MLSFAVGWASNNTFTRTKYWSIQLCTELGCQNHIVSRVIGIWCSGFITLKCHLLILADCKTWNLHYIHPLGDYCFKENCVFLWYHLCNRVIQSRKLSLVCSAVSVNSIVWIFPFMQMYYIYIYAWDLVIPIYLSLSDFIHAWRSMVGWNMVNIIWVCFGWGVH